jgi:hypothetical protein
MCCSMHDIIVFDKLLHIENFSETCRRISDASSKSVEERDNFRPGDQEMIYHIIETSASILWACCQLCWQAR